MLKDIVFISDLHLDTKYPEIAEIFLRFLRTCSVNTRELYILGDFFEYWIGDDNLTPFNLKIIQELKNATDAGLKIYFMHGNRDFLIKQKFLTMTGCILLPDEYVIDLFGQKTLLMHGDTLCTADVAYQRFRKKSRNWFFQQLFLWKSLPAREKIVERYRKTSQEHMRNAPEHIMDVTQHEVERVMKKHHVSHLIHGHTHRPFVHQFSLNNQPATRTVLAAWHEKGNALLCTPDGKQELVYF